MNEQPRLIVLRGDPERSGQTHNWLGDRLYIGEASIMLHSHEELLLPEGGFNPKVWAGRQVRAKRFDATGNFETIEDKKHEIFQFVENVEQFIPVAKD